MLLLAGPSPGLNHGHRRASVRPAPLILSELQPIEDVAIPGSFDWRSVDGRSLVTADVNQHIPMYCGSCWIHGTIAALNDRIKIMRNGKFPDVMLSRQVAMNCVHGLDDVEKNAAPPGCNGGDPWAIHSHMVRSPLPDESCQPYEAKNGLCEPAGQCRNCYHPSMVADPTVPRVDYTSPGCFAVDTGVTYGVREYGGVLGPLAMQKEILARGPIVCSFAADSTFMLQFEERLVEGVYVDPTYFETPLPHNNTEVDHDVEVRPHPWRRPPGPRIPDARALPRAPGDGVGDDQGRCALLGDSQLLGHVLGTARLVQAAARRQSSLHRGGLRVGCARRLRPRGARRASRARASRAPRAPRASPARPASPPRPAPPPRLPVRTRRDARTVPTLTSGSPSPPQENLAAPKVGDYVHGTQSVAVDELGAPKLKEQAIAAVAAAAKARAARASAAAAAPRIEEKEKQARAAEDAPSLVGAGGLLLTEAHPADAPPAHPSGGPRHEQEKAHSERAATMPRPVAPAPEGSATAHDAAGGAGRAAPAARSFGWAAMWVSVGIAAAVAWPTLYQAATHVRHAWAREREREDSVQAWQAAETSASYQPM